MDVGGRLDLVERLGRLRDDGALTDEEFASAKAGVLEGAPLGGEPSVGYQQAESFRAAAAPVSKWIGAGVVVLIVVAIVSYVALQPSEFFAPTRPATNQQSGQGAQQQRPTQGASDGSNSATAQADDALNSASAAVDAAGADLASASADLTSAAPQTAEQSAAEAVPARPVLETKAARCKIKSPGIDEFTSPCTFKKFSPTEFEVTTPQFAYSFDVVQQSDGHHGMIVMPDGHQTDLGRLTQTGACWNNTQAKICAWAI
jgi:hypothetical protein